MQIIDTHCHYNLEPLWPEWQKHWVSAQASGVTHSVVVGTNVTTSRQALEIAASEANLRVAVGIHPSEYQEQLETPATFDNQQVSLTEIDTLASQAKVVAIGETGLDYFRLPDDQALQTQIKAAQQAAFEGHLVLAKKHDLPVIVHVRDVGEAAYWDVLALLKKHSLTQPFILHCVSGPIEYVKQALDLGAYLGLAGNLTYKTADHLRSIAKIAPADRLLLETDAPFLPPVPHRGQTCEPWMIAKTALFLQTELGLNLDQLHANSQFLLD